MFELTGRDANVVVETDTDLYNQWVFVEYSLIDEQTGRAFEFGREVSYYAGRDSDGSWTEGDRVDRARLGPVPAGRYFLRIAGDRPVGEPFIDLILETNWSSGRIVRDFTMLFDPPSMRQPPAEVVAVLAFAGLDRTSVPAPSLVIVPVPARTEEIVAVTPGSTEKFAGDGVIVRVDAAIV